TLVQVLETVEIRTSPGMAALTVLPPAPQAADPGAAAQEGGGRITVQGLTIDFARQTDFGLALLAAIVLSVWGMLVLMVDVFQKGSRTGPSWRGLGWFTLVGLVLAAAANWWLGGLSEANLAGSIALDSFRIFSNFIFLASGAFFVLIA